MKSSRGHGEHGEVCSVGDDYSSKGKRVRVTVKHGKRKAQKKGKGGNVGMSDYDDRPESTFSVPREKAAHYPVGKKVRVAVHPARSSKKKQGESDAIDDLYGGKSV